jgi:acetyl esterase/lipase
MKIDPAMMDPDVAEQYKRNEAFGPLPENLDAARAVFRERQATVAAAAASERTGLTVEDASVPSLIDDHAIAVRVYRPIGRPSGRGLLHIHGGGFLFGDLDLDDHHCWVWAREANCVVVSVAYRLAPEHQFPVPLEDCYSALSWVAENAAELSIDPRTLGVAGNSAGGALAAGLCLLARDRGGPAIAFQMLLYAVLDASYSSGAMQTASAEELRQLQRVWERYLGQSPLEAPAYASPAAAEDLTGLPSAYVVTAELDRLRDEGLTYAQRLLDSSVSVELRMWPRVPHSFEHIAPASGLARQALAEQAQAIKRGLSAIQSPSVA